MQMWTVLHAFDMDTCFMLMIYSIFPQVILNLIADISNDYYDCYCICLSIVLNILCFTDETELKQVTMQNNRFDFYQFEML